MCQAAVVIATFVNCKESHQFSVNKDDKIDQQLVVQSYLVSVRENADQTSTHIRLRLEILLLFSRIRGPKCTQEIFKNRNNYKVKNSNLTHHQTSDTVTLRTIHIPRLVSNSFKGLKRIKFFYWCFGDLPQWPLLAFCPNFKKWQGPTNCNLAFYECSLWGGDNQRQWGY